LDLLLKHGPQPSSTSIETLQSQVMEVVRLQEEAEKTLVDHDATHADQWDVTNGDIEGDEEDDDEVVAAHAQKRNALHTELHNLNSALAQKEKLASAMVHNEEKLKEMRKKYEANLHSLEDEVKALQKEKDELSQQQRNAPSNDHAAAKIAEQRRKRIQELEAKLMDLKKQVLEQQRALKVNERNEAQLKKLAEEIRQLKQAKVKLIRQFKEDAEKLRAYKQEKEKEVMRLKQNERKQQAKLVKMENLHTKQQNVVKRKLEEAQTMNKRLKDLLEKQKANAKHRGIFANGRGGMEGAGERVRNWVNEEMNVVVSVREATQSKDLLLNDRKALTKQLNDLKQGLRGTMSGNEMKETQEKMDKLKEELDLRNSQISQLQKQIADLEASESAGPSSTSNAPTSNSRGSRFDTFKTLTEAKIALEHLFDKSVEQQFMSTQLKSEFEELRQLYNEAVKNTNNLEVEIATMKNEHETNMVRTQREHEEKILVLLNDIADTKDTNAGSETPSISKVDIRMASKLNDELTKMSAENERLRKEIMGKELSAKVKFSESKLKRKISSKDVNKKKEEARYTMEEMCNGSDTENSFADDPNNDPDWERTPLFARIKKLRENTNNGTLLVDKKRKKNAASSEGSSDGWDSSDEENNGSFKKKRRRTPVNGDICKCKGKCNTKRCPCVKNGPICTAACKCDVDACRNRDSDRNASSVLADCTNNDTANTMSLLNDTFPVAKEEGLSATFSLDVQETPRKPLPPPSSAHQRSYFKSPI